MGCQPWLLLHSARISFPCRDLVIVCIMILRISLAPVQHTQSHLTLISRMLSLLPLPVAADLTWVSQQLFGLPLLVEWHWTSVSPQRTLLPLEVEASACSIPCLPTSLTRQDLYAPCLALPQKPVVLHASEPMQIESTTVLTKWKRYRIRKETNIPHIISGVWQTHHPHCSNPRWQSCHPCLESDSINTKSSILKRLGHILEPDYIVLERVAVHRTPYITYINTWCAETWYSFLWVFFCKWNQRTNGPVSPSYISYNQVDEFTIQTSAWLNTKISDPTPTLLTKNWKNLHDAIFMCGGGCIWFSRLAAQPLELALCCGKLDKHTGLCWKDIQHNQTSNVLSMCSNGKYKNRALNYAVIISKYLRPFTYACQEMSTPRYRTLAP